jgi:tetratricopeptide (TPR) repeat protein
VLEERRARPGWGEGPTPAFLRAYAAGRVPPPSRLDAGFTRPAFPEQVVFSYYAASLVCEMLEQEDARALPALLAAYRDGLAPAAAIARATGGDPAALDRRFDAYVRRRFAGAFAAVGAPGQPGAAAPFARALAEARAHAAAGRVDDAVRGFERAKAMFPEYAEDDSPYRELARLHLGRGDARRAAAELAALAARNGGAYDAHVELAALLERAGDAAGEAAALERAIYVSPYDVGVHQRLAALAAGLGDHRRAVRERRAVVALAPVDAPDALYQLARALQRAGDAAGARREVLRALELAPSFAPAQELLLELQPGGGGAG